LCLWLSVLHPSAFRSKITPLHHYRPLEFSRLPVPERHHQSFHWEAYALLTSFSCSPENGDRDLSSSSTLSRSFILPSTQKPSLSPFFRPARRPSHSYEAAVFSLQSFPTPPSPFSRLSKRSCRLITQPSPLSCTPPPSPPNCFLLPCRSARLAPGRIPFSFFFSSRVVGVVLPWCPFMWRKSPLTPLLDR